MQAAVVEGVVVAVEDAGVMLPQGQVQVQVPVEAVEEDAEEDAAAVADVAAVCYKLIINY